MRERDIGRSTSESRKNEPVQPNHELCIHLGLDGLALQAGPCYLSMFR